MKFSETKVFAIFFLFIYFKFDIVEILVFLGCTQCCSTCCRKRIHVFRGPSS